jgi:oligosaccharide repeat unit polymerase
MVTTTVRGDMQQAMSLILAASLLVFAVALAEFKRDALHPACLQSGLWGVVCLIYFTTPHSYRPVSLDTIVLIVGASLAFAIASLAQPPVPIGADQHYETTFVRPLLFWLALLALPAFVMRGLAIAQTVEITDSTFINLRLALTKEDGDLQSYGVFAYLLPVACTSASVELAASRRHGFKLKFWIALAVAVCYSLSSAGRTAIFFLLIALSFIALLQRRVRPLQMLSIFGVAGSLVFIVIGMLLNKIGSDSPNANALGVLDAFALYLLSGLAAFDLSIHQPYALGLGSAVFRSVPAVLSALGFKVEVVSTIKEFVYVPEPTNVYTVFYPYAIDFGVAGVIAFLALLGWIHASLFRSARQGNPRSLVLYSMSMYPLFMQFFDDQYFSLLSMWINYAVLVVACFRRHNAPSFA